MIKFAELTEVRDTAELVRRAQAGDSIAFGELFEQFQPTVLAIAQRRLGDHSDAQELCQDVFLKAMQKISQLREPEAFAGWIKSITVRMAINLAQRRREVSTCEFDSLAMSSGDRTSPFESAVAEERRQHVRRGLDRLRETDRETLVAFYVRGKSLLEMSDEFDAPVGTIKRRLHVARRRLADQVEALSTV
jgi:RNA polymerase sigma-70 factor (ECF subfamily)